MSIIPDNVIFGIDSLGNPIDYAYVRSVTNESELIELLRLRLKVFFVDQVQPLQQSKSAFPLTTMTCIGIETLGEAFVTPKSGDTSFQFVEIIKQVHQVFGRKPSKKYNSQLATIWQSKDLSNIDCYGKILYRFFRNTMIHGYQAKGVFLSYEDTNNIEIDEQNAFLKINPNWYWNSFKDYLERKFHEIQNAQTNNTYRKNCLDYINNLLN